MSFASDPLKVSDADVLAEAERQLNVCNSCRYCEGYCAVFPALERRSVLSRGDVIQLANLCHDCRACLHACMYAPPHEFGINPPKVLSELRRRTWSAELPLLADRLPRRARGWVGTVVAFVAVVVIVVGLAGLSEGLAALWAPREGVTSPYDVISYPALLVTMTIPFAWAAVVMGQAAGRYWKQTWGPLRDLWDLGAWRTALREAGELRYLKGGGAGCQYPKDRPSQARRRLHAAMAYGFAACLVSTVAAGISQDTLGIDPPYPVVSVPVLAGTIGGAALVAGSVGLLVLRASARSAAEDQDMQAMDVGLLSALAILGVTGLLTLVLRSSTIYGPALVVHLAAVGACFAVAPYSKFNHVLYRLLALVQDNLERAREGR